MVVAAQLRDWTARRVSVDRSSEQAFLAVCVLLFAVSTAVTIVWCAPMSAMGMPMPGGWTMSMVWMSMPGQSWIGAAASFLGMWIVMMVAMMLPSLVPMLRRYRKAIDRAEASPSGRLTARVCAGYFFVWTAIGMLVFPLGLGLADVEMRQPALARAIPLASGLIVLIAGTIQFTEWKTRLLARCTRRTHEGTAWQHGVRLGVDCARSCGNVMVILLVMGVMDLRVMALVAAAITIERVVPASHRVVRLIGVAIAAAGLILIAQAAALEL